MHSNNLNIYFPSLERNRIVFDSSLAEKSNINRNFDKSLNSISNFNRSDNRPLHKAGIQERIAKLKQSSITIQNPISKTHDSKLVHHHTSVPTNNDSIAVFNVNNDLKSSSFTKERLDKHINEPTQNIESDYLNRMKGYENKPIQPVDKEKNINVNSDIKKKEKCDIKPLENYNEYRAQIPHKRKPKTIFNHDMQPDNSFPKWDNVESKEIKPDVYISSKSPVKPKHTDKSEKSLKKHSIPEEMFTIATNVAKDITKNYVSKVKFDEYVVDTNSKFEKLYTAYKEKINSITKEMDEETKKRKIMEVSLKRIYNLALENNWNLEK
ncbi:hypothetical protein A3Q56_04369 [Intoshia linei]|uniref:Uncharacterized protein n=1 Tax=Intoshia linei TaxID=1819745 RepID=A0A177B1A2_9BILA|nr:hypothetical protein A3Q56_04369 [Intoshia linei]